MKHFTQFLNNLNDKIDLPQPLKSRIILEIAADLNDTYKYYLNSGLPDSEAVKKAKEKFEITDSIIADLSRLHTNLFRQWLEKTIGKTQDIWERILFFLLFAFLILATIFSVLTTPFLSKSSVFAYPLVLFFVAVVLTWSAKFYQLYIKKDHNIKHLNSGIFLFKLFGIAILFSGFAGYFVELYFSGGEAMIMGPLFIILISDAHTLSLTLEFLIKSSSLMMICMMAILISGLLWFSLMQKIHAIEKAEAEILLAQ